MAKVNDYSLDDEKRRQVRRHAERVLREADALGRFPTPIDDVMEVAEVVVADEPLVDEGFLAGLRRTARDAGAVLRRALKKVIAVLHAAGRIIYLDQSIHVAQKPFIKLHETGHAVLPWQRDSYALTEDSEKTLRPDIADEFEREASNFASDVLFQLDSFRDEACQSAFNILVPVRLSKRYGASLYMSIRRYVREHHRACTVLVLEPPQLCSRRGFRASLRREVGSPEFERIFGELDWPDEFGPDDEIGAAIPIAGRRMSRPREITLVNRNGVRHRCIAEAFTQTRHVFVLIHSIATLTRTTILMPTF